MSAPVAPQELVAMVESELATITDERVLGQIRSLLVTPVCERRMWDYSEPDQRIDCWIVLRDPETRISLAYCNEGFGPRCPWGMMWDGDLSLPHSSMGMDSSWHTTFLDIYFDSQVRIRLPIWRVFEGKLPEWPGTPVSGELSWDDAWRRVEELQSAASDNSFHVWHTTH